MGICGHAAIDHEKGGNPEVGLNKDVSLMKTVLITHNIYNTKSNLENGSTPRTFSNFPTIHVLRGLLYPLPYLISFQGNLLLIADITRRSLANLSLSVEPFGTPTLTISFL